jgi:GNAT superfamily N-acetyltransferase
MPLTIRRATRRDIPGLLPMVQALAAHHGDNATVTADSLARDIIGRTPWFTVLLAQTGTQALGYAGLTRIGRLHYGQRAMDLHHLFVWPEHRGCGIGRALIDATVAHARTKGCATLLVGTADANRAAQDIYLRYGFTPRTPGGKQFLLDLTTPP